MKLSKTIKVLTITLFLMLVSTVTVEAIVYEPLPNRPEFRGFYYWLDMADYRNILQSDMSHEVMIGYIVADSVVRTMPSITYMYDPIKEMNVFSDTAQYINKYWYLMNDYDPLRFWWFLTRKYPEAKNRPSRLHSDMRSRMYINPQFTYVVSDYILHIRVNNTVHIDTSYTKGIFPDPRTIAYCQVLDNIKGRTFPSLNNALFYNGERQDGEDGIIDISYALPSTQTDIVFSYNDDWQWGEYGMPLFTQRDGHWVKPNREYIVFLEVVGFDAVGSWDTTGGTEHKIYYALMPYPHTKSYSMYQIENGYVIDRRNALGFGARIPVEEFKERIRNEINEIKSFGE